MSKKPRRVQFDLDSRPQSRSGDFDELFATDGDAARASSLQLRDIALNAIESDPGQPRSTFNDASLAELRDSIIENGIIQPIEVVQIDRNRYRIVHGERRWRAAAMAGLATMPAIVQRRDYDDVTRFVRQMVENIQREDLNDVDRAAGLVHLRDLMQQQHSVEDEAAGRKPWSTRITWAKVGDRLGVSRQRIHQLVKLLELPEAIQSDVRDGRLSERDARLFQGLTERQQLQLHQAWRAAEVDSQTLQAASKLLKAGKTGSVRQAVVLAQTGSRPATASGSVRPIAQLTRMQKQLAKLPLADLDAAEAAQAAELLASIRHDITQLLNDLRQR